jgi:peptidoglycan/xylan/chitin deacetylase (PgdA/CDA1 family)
MDAPITFWWDRLQAAYDAQLPVARVVPGTDLHAMASAMEGWPRARREAASAALAALGADPPPVRLTADEVRELARDQDVGFHTLRHDPFTGLDDAELADALTAGRQRLESEIGRTIDMLAYPHGQAGEREARAARAAGYRCAFTTTAVPCAPGTDPMRIGRAELGHAPLGLFAVRVERALGRSR